MSKEVIGSTEWEMNAAKHPQLFETIRDQYKIRNKAYLMSITKTQSYLYKLVYLIKNADMTLFDLNPFHIYRDVTVLFQPLHKQHQTMSQEEIKEKVLQYEMEEIKERLY
jgi:hypothetical protein